MPNWCYNTLTVRGYEADIAKFRKQAKSYKIDGEDSVITLSSFVPPPEELKNTIARGGTDSKPNKKLMEKYGADNWYDWQVNNWGTKWDIAEVAALEDDEDFLEYGFDSAWSPPVEWLEKVAKQYPELEFGLKYEEEGIGFMGYAKGYNGVVRDECINM
jgi:hypothetical protein